jgi:hypothetical protein
MKDFIINYENELKNKAFEMLDDAFNKCSAEILFIKPNNILIHIPKYFHDLIDDSNPFSYRGYTVEIGYENEIVIFDKENGFATNRIFKYKIN